MVFLPRTEQIPVSLSRPPQVLLCKRKGRNMVRLWQAYYHDRKSIIHINHHCTSWYSFQKKFNGYQNLRVEVGLLYPKNKLVWDTKVRQYICFFQNSFCLNSNRTFNSHPTKTSCHKFHAPVFHLLSTLCNQDQKFKLSFFHIHHSKMC